MSTRPASATRRWLVRWLYAAAGAHLLVGLVLTWLGDAALFEPYHRSIEAAFWGAAVPEPARAEQIWWIALFGATLQSYAVSFIALVYLGHTSARPAAWGGLIASIVLWAPQDIWVSLQRGIVSHLWVDSIALLVLLPPLFWLYRHDSRAR